MNVNDIIFNSSLTAWNIDQEHSKQSEVTKNDEASKDI